MYLNLPMKLWTLLTMNYLCYRVLGATLVRETTWFLFDFGINNQLLLHLFYWKRIYYCSSLRKRIFIGVGGRKDFLLIFWFFVMFFWKWVRKILMSMFKRRRGKRRVLERSQNRLIEAVSLNKYIRRKFLLINSLKFSLNLHKILFPKKIPS